VAHRHIVRTPVEQRLSAPLALRVFYNLCCLAKYPTLRLLLLNSGRGSHVTGRLISLPGAAVRMTSRDMAGHQDGRLATKDSALPYHYLLIDMPAKL